MEGEGGALTLRAASSEEPDRMEGEVGAWVVLTFEKVLLRWSLSIGVGWG